jgi:hypothetical protein
MEYLNNFTPSSMLLEEISSHKEFTRGIILDTIIDQRAQDKSAKGIDISFDPDKVVFEGPEVGIEFIDESTNEPKKVKFDAVVLSDGDQPGFTALEMFQHILSFEVKLNGESCSFKHIEYVRDVPWGGRLIPLYKVHFGLKY